jgi:hypothetical protein
MAELSPKLNQELTQANASDLVEVVVELRRDLLGDPDRESSRNEQIAALKESFNREVEPVEEVIRQAGGEITGRAWINQTLRARIPAEKVKDLASHESVQSVDVPHAITRDLA